MPGRACFERCKHLWLARLEHQPQAARKERRQYLNLLKDASFESFFSLVSQDLPMFASFFSFNTLGRFGFAQDLELKEEMKIAFCRFLIQYAAHCDGLRSLLEGNLFDSLLFGSFGSIVEVQREEKRFLVEQSKSMVLVPAGAFVMGDNWGRGNGPCHRVEITHDLLVSRYLTTQIFWLALMGRNPSHFQGATRPVERITWYDAIRFANVWSAEEGFEKVYDIKGASVTLKDDANGYRLLTEAEWERTAKGGRGSVYAGGEQLDELGWFWENSLMATHPVAQKRPNSFGLYDMSGNVFEWCFDTWKEDLYRERSTASICNPVQWEDEELDRVRRGGYWHFVEAGCRTSYRHRGRARSKSYTQGLRMCRRV